MLDRQRLVWSRQAEKLNVAYVSSDASHFSPKQTAKTERQVWRKSWASSAALPDGHQYPLPGSPIT